MMNKKNALIVLFVFAFQVALPAGDVVKAENGSYTDAETLAIFELFIQRFEENPNSFESEVVDKVNNLDDAKRQIYEVCNKYLKKEKELLPASLKLGQVQEYKGFFVRILKDDAYNVVYFFCKKGGAKVYVAKFGPSST